MPCFCSCLGGADAFPGRGELDEDALAADLALGIVVDDLARRGRSRRRRRTTGRRRPRWRPGPGRVPASAAPTETASRSATAATRASALAVLPARPRRRPRSSCPRTRASRAPSARSRGWWCSRRASAGAPPRCRRCRRRPWSSSAADRVSTPSGCFFRLAFGGEWQVNDTTPRFGIGSIAAARCGRPTLAIPIPAATITRPTRIGGRVADQEDHQRRRRGGRRDARRHPRGASAASRRASTAARGPSWPATGPRPGKVGLVIGGGSGHEPTFVGFVGRGLADAAAIGNVFASPPPDPILAVHPGGQRRGRRALHVRQLCRRRDELRHGRRDGGDGGYRGPHGPDHRRRRLGAARPAREPARGGGQLLHLQGGGRGLRPDAAARRGRAGGAQGERPHLHHGRGAGALLAAADPPAELRDRRRRDGDRHGHPRRAGGRARAAASRPTPSSTR